MLAALDALGPTIRASRTVHAVPHRAAARRGQGGELRVRRPPVGDATGQRTAIAAAGPPPRLLAPTARTPATSPARALLVGTPMAMIDRA